MSSIVASMNRQQMKRFGQTGNTKLRLTPGRWMMILGLVASIIGALILYNTREMNKKEEVVFGIAASLLILTFYIGMMAPHASFTFPAIGAGVLAFINAFLTLDKPSGAKRSDHVKGIYIASGTLLVLSLMGLFVARAEATWQQHMRPVYTFLSVLGIGGAVFNFIIPSL